MNKSDSKIKYFLYARKSSEDEDRQMQSVPDQIKVMGEIAKTRNLRIIKTYSEEKSAKIPDKRQQFNEMISQIEKGIANGVICWEINRLSRNPKESGMIQQLLQDHFIKEIVTSEKTFQSDDNAVLFAVESSMANQYSRDLSRNVKRGMDQKAKNGGFNGCSSIGYKNFTNPDKHRFVIKDPDRFHLVRKMWDLMLTGNHRPTEILQIANEQWGLRTVKHKKRGGCEFSRSGIYAMFTNLFYAGVVVYNGEQYQGLHPAMVTLEEYDRVQVLLGRKGRPRPRTHEFAFTGLVRCGTCGCRITAEEKTKHLQNNNETKKYVYYHCTKRKKGFKCLEKSITLPEFESQIEKEINKIQILPEFKELALQYLNETNDNEIENRTKTYQQQQKTINETQGFLDNLTRMRYREMIDDDKFIKEKKILENEIENIKKAIGQTEQRAQDWLELCEKNFNFAVRAINHFNSGDLKKKKEILSYLGTEFVLKDKRLEIQLTSWLQPISNDYKPLEQRFNGLEPNLKSRLTDTKYTKSELLNSLRHDWWTVGDSNS